MALERRNLREELVAVIGAGRELSPEHDYQLADIFIATLHHAPTHPQQPTLWEQLNKHAAALMTAGLISLAALMLLFAAALGHGGGDRGDHGFFFNGGTYQQPDSRNWDLPGDFNQRQPDNQSPAPQSVPNS